MDFSLVSFESSSAKNRHPMLDWTKLNLNCKVGVAGPGSRYQYVLPGSTLNDSLTS